MSYLVEQTPFAGSTRTEIKIDMVSFARDLAKALDKLLTSTAVKLLPAGDYPNESQTIRVGNDNLNLHAVNHKRTVSASIAAPDVPWGDRNTYDKSHRTEQASVNPDGRKIEAIAADIYRRVIVASQAALAKQREYKAMQAEARASIVRVSAALKERLPALNLRVNEQEKRAAIYNGGDGHYLSGTLNADGTVGIDRIGSMSVETFVRIVEILNEKKGSQS